MLKDIIKKIEYYDDIVLYRHVNPDYDALGSQLGMYSLITTTYPDKNVYIEGEMTSDLVEKYDVIYTQSQCMFDKQTLGIVMDTANMDRIDGISYTQCKELIKIDHHPLCEEFGDIAYVDSTASSCSQLVGNLLKENMMITKEGASALYMGIIGDTNRFYYNTTDKRTFDVAGMLIKQGIDIQNIYETMYLRSLRDLYVNQFVYSHFKLDDGVAYYILKDEDLKSLNITREMGSNYVTLLSNIKEIKVWLAITENVKDQNWRVSIRSRNTVINDVAAKYNGGGHMFASGATLTSIEQLPLLLEDIKEKLNV